MPKPQLTTLQKLETTTTAALTPGQRLTLYVMLGAGVAVAAYDFYAARQEAGDGSDTESWIITTLSSKYPSIPFGFGFLMGHFFAGQHDIPE
jgi:hypothetical protein